MLKNSDSSNGLLKNRLKGSASSNKSPAPNISTLKHRNAESDSIPSYSTDTHKSAFDESDSDVQPIRQVKAPKLPKKKKSGSTLKNRMSRTTNNTDSDAESSFDNSFDDIEDAADFDEEIDIESYQTQNKRSRSHKILNRIAKVTLTLLAILCLYVAFLIYGLIQTSYVYNDSGAIETEILSVEDLKTLNQYNTLSNYYLRTRILYENVLSLDYELAQDSGNSRAVARKYLSLLDNISKLSTDLSANELDTEYAGIVNQMYELVYTHIAVYLQNMSGAISDNDSNKANQAISGREVIQETFASLTANMADLCKTTRGAKNGDMYNWSPESYIASLGGGSNNGQK